MPIPMTSPIHTRVMVYGTLRRGKGNNHLLRYSEYVGRTLIKGKLSLYDMGGIPALVERSEGDDSSVLVDVYDVPPDTLTTLDMLEGHPDWYQRKVATTDIGEGWVYTMPIRANVPRTWQLLDGGWRLSEEETEWLRNVPKEASDGSAA